MQPVQGNESWQQFRRLAHNAKVRNAGFDLPLTPKNARVSPGRKQVVRNLETAVPSMGKFYNSQAPQKQKPALGTRFDAYA